MLVIIDYYNDDISDIDIGKGEINYSHPEDKNFSNKYIKLSEKYFITFIFKY